MRSSMFRKTTFVLIYFLIAALPIGETLAVERGKTSYTAEAVCAVRSIGALDPDPKTRNPDHMAKLFVNHTTMRSFPGLGLEFEDAKLAMDQMNNGLLYYINARTHHMDAMLKKALASGFTQVVIMGAGFDSRAYRFHEAYPHVHFFEIDLPATSEDKQRRVAKILGKRPEWVTFVPIDFNTQTLEDVLGKAGFKKNQKTFYVWEGVTYFISEFGVDSTLRFIAENSAPGSRIVFDYMLEDVVKGANYSPYGARRIVFVVAFRGEPYVFGIAPQESEAFVNLRGLSLLSDLSPEDLTRRYLVQSNGAVSGKIAEFLRIVHVEVPEAAERASLAQEAQKRMKRFTDKKHLDGTHHRVKVPKDIQALLDRYCNAVKNKEFSALSDCFSARYLSNGRTRQMVLGWLKRTYENRPVHEYKIVLTHLSVDGDRAKIDGFFNRKGFRTPVMVHDLIREADGRWRWYGNQQ